LNLILCGCHHTTTIFQLLLQQGIYKFQPLYEQITLKTKLQLRWAPSSAFIGNYPSTQLSFLPLNERLEKSSGRKRLKKEDGIERFISLYLTLGEKAIKKLNLLN